MELFVLPEQKKVSIKQYNFLDMIKLKAEIYIVDIIMGYNYNYNPSNTLKCKTNSSSSKH